MGVITISREFGSGGREIGKRLADELGYASDMKAYKENPAAFGGSVADVSMFLRVAVTGRLNSPDMYAVMQILGYERVCARIRAMLAKLN